MNGFRTLGRRTRLLTHRATVLLSAVVALALLTTVPARAQDSTDEPAESTPRLTVLRQSSEVEPDGRFTVALEVTGADGGDVAVDIYDRITTRAGLPDSGTPPSDPAATFETIPLADRARQTVRFTIHLYDRGQDRPADAGAWAWRLTEAGTYPVRIRLRGSDGANLVTSFTYLIRRPSPEVTAPTADVAFLLDLSPDDADETALDADVVRPVIELFEDHPDVPVTLTVDPDVLESTARTPDGRSLVRDIRRLADSDRTELLGAPLVEIDPASLTAAGLSGSIPTQARLGDEVLRALLDRPGSTTWWLPRHLDAPSVEVLRSAGVEHLIVPSGSLIGDAPLVPTPLLGVDASFSVVAAASNVPTGKASDTVLASRRWVANSSAQATIAGATGSATVAEVDPRTVDLAVLENLLGLLDGRTMTVRPVSLSTLFGETAATTTPMALSAPELEEMGTYVRARERLVAQAGSFAAMQVGEAQDATGRDKAMARSERAGLTSSQRLSALARIESSLRSTYRSITTSSNDRITLGTRNANIPLPIESGADEPLRVRIQLSASNRIEFERSDFEVVIEPGRTTVPIPVRVRTSGDIPMQVRITTPDGAITLAESAYTIRSTAVSGVGIVLTLGAAGFLALWWGRHILRIRRSRRARSRSQHPTRARTDKTTEEPDDVFIEDEDVTVDPKAGSKSDRPGTNERGPDPT